MVGLGVQWRSLLCLETRKLAVQNDAKKCMFRADFCTKAGHNRRPVNQRVWPVIGCQQSAVQSADWRARAATRHVQQADSRTLRNL